MSEDNIREVEIPARKDHCGLYKAKVNIKWICPVCGGPRGEIFRTTSFDGAKQLSVDGWVNPCGHIDVYQDVIEEARRNGLNDNLKLPKITAAHARLQRGVWFRSAITGGWYTNHSNEGVVDMVMVDGVVFVPKLPKSTYMVDGLKSEPQLEGPNDDD